MSCLYVTLEILRQGSATMQFPFTFVPSPAQGPIAIFTGVHHWGLINLYSSAVERNFKSIVSMLTDRLNYFQKMCVFHLFNNIPTALFLE